MLYHMTVSISAWSAQGEVILADMGRGIITPHDIAEILLKVALNSINPP
jgi:hypothetical protein